MAKNKSVSRPKKILAGFIISVVAVAIVVLVTGRLYFRIPAQDYYKASTKAFLIPGLSDGLVAQGIDYVEPSGVYLVGGYQKDGSASRIYRVDKESGRAKGYVVLGDKDGNGIAPHAGGLAANGKYLYVAGDEDTFVYVFDLDEVLSGNSGNVVKTKGTFDTKFGNIEVRADFMCFADGKFFVGEFYREPNYPTPDSHIYTGASGETNHAMALSFKVNSDLEFGLEKQAFEVYSLPEKVQGIAVYDGKIWLSQSYATATSIISSYDVSGKSSGVIDNEIGTAKIYSLDGKTLVSTFKAPPMAEEIVFVDGRMLIMCESASSKYLFGNITGGRWCYATDIKEV